MQTRAHSIFFSPFSLRRQDVDPKVASKGEHLGPFFHSDHKRRLPASDDRLNQIAFFNTQPQ